MELKVYEFDLALRYPFRISRHKYESIQTLIVELRQDHSSGYGEATTNPYYKTTLKSLISDFSRLAESLEDYRLFKPEKLWEKIKSVSGVSTFALSAVDCAAHDLAGKMHRRSFRYQYGIDYHKYPFTSYTLGIGTGTEIIDKIQEFPWPVYKVKLGGDHDMEVIHLIRENTDSILRIDANAGWSLEKALDYSAFLKDHNIEFIEQPLPADKWEDMKKLKDRSPLPFFADESCQREEDVDKCNGYFDGINIKLSKCGGLSPALRMIYRARELGLKVMIGCMTETTVGIAAAAQLLPLVDYADLDGPLLLKEDVATGIKYRDGFLKLKKDDGLGISFRYKKYETEWT